MEEKKKNLEELGAEVEVLDQGLKLIGDWKEEYNDYHDCIVEITGYLDTSDALQDKDFLRNLNTLGYLYTSHVIQDKDFLRNLNTLGSLDTYKATQDKDFLRNLNTLGRLSTLQALQDKDFLRNLNTLGDLYTSHVIQHKDFLQNLNTLGRLGTHNAIQDKDFLNGVGRSFDLPYLYADGILSYVHCTKEVKGYTIYETTRIGYTEVEYVASDGDNYSHASSIRSAILDLRFKLSDRDTSWLDNKTLESILSTEDSILAYRCITGACSGGVEGFLKGIKEKESYTIEEIISLTSGQYGNQTFKQFFNQ